jgi:hypothetical protein
MVTSDLLAAASLLVTLVSALYAVWYPELSKAINAPVARHRADRDPIIADTRSTLVGRAVPLWVASTCLGIVLLPPFLDTIAEALNALGHGLGSLPSYDAVRACFALVYLLAAFLALTTSRSTIGIARRLQRLRAAEAVNP